jgi:flavin reductase
MDFIMVTPQQIYQTETAPPFLTAMLGAVTPVTVVTTEGPAGRFGVTVSAFASVCADPPMVLVCINSRSPAVTAIDQNGCFCVNLLGDTQTLVADCFSGRTDPSMAYEFGCADWQSGATGAPILAHANANFDCLVENNYAAGTHRIFIGLVRDVLASKSAPLAYSKRSYQAVSPLT